MSWVILYQKVSKRSMRMCENLDPYPFICIYRGYLYIYICGYIRHTDHERWELELSIWVKWGLWVLWLVWELPLQKSQWVTRGGHAKCCIITGLDISCGLWVILYIYMENWLRYILRVIRLSARCHGQVSWIRFTWGDGHAPSGPLWKTGGFAIPSGNLT